MKIGINVFAITMHIVGIMVSIKPANLPQVLHPIVAFGSLNVHLDTLQKNSNI